MQTHSTHSNDVRIFMQKIMEEAKIQCNVATDLQFLILIRSSSEHVVKRHPSRDCRIDFAVTCCWRVNYAAAPSLDVGRRRSGTPLCQNKQARCQFHPLHIMDLSIRKLLTAYPLPLAAPYISVEQGDVIHIFFHAHSFRNTLQHIRSWLFHEHA
jgi:hypothetical protein